MTQFDIFAVVKKYLILLLVAVLAIGCGKDLETEECVPAPPDVPKITLSFEVLHDSIAAITTKAQLVSFLSRHPHFRDYTLGRTQYQNDSAFINTMFHRFTHPAFDTLAMETTRVFGDLSDLKAQFQEGFSNIKAYYPDFKIPRVEAVISGLDSDLFVSDSVIVVSLDYYLGKNAKYRPKTYEYLLRKYEPEDIVPSILLLHGIGAVNKTNLNDKTVLAEMIAYGKAFYYAKRMLPCTPDSVFIWYSADEIKGARENEDLIWARLIQDKVVYSTSMIDKRNYLGERPFTIQVGEKCPGRIGQWVGWRIIKEYMKNHPDVSLTELMAMDNAQQLFKESGYKPKRR